MESNVSFKTTHLEVILSYLVQYIHEVTLPDIFWLRPILGCYRLVSRAKITTLPVRPAPPSPDRIPALYGYPLDSGDDSSDEDLSETAKSLHTQTASILVVHPPPTQSLPTSPAFAQIPSLSSPPSLLTSSPSPPPSLLPSSSHKRSRSPSPSLPSSVSPSPPSSSCTHTTILAFESVGDDIEASFWDLERHLGP
ncbi:hypothetical protein Tco_1181898 [Tanacetum coccineum]